jgi:neutral amino acid transport system permease protein
MRSLCVTLLAALLAPLFLLLSSPPANATETLCLPSPTTGCIAGTLRTEEGVVPDVDLVVTGPGGFDETVTTSESGRWNVQVTEPGPYEIAIDEETLPDEVVTEGTASVVAQLGQTRAGLIEVRTTGFTSEGSTWDLVAQSAVSGLRLGLLLALAAVGLSLIYGTTGLSSFSHAEQVTLGGMVAFLLINRGGMPFLLGAALTVALCAATGLFQDMVLWKPLRRRGLGLVQQMIVTIGLSLAMQYGFQVAVGARQVRVISASPKTVEIGPVVLTHQSYWAMGVSVVVLVAVGLVLLRTRIGRATRAVSDNPALAAASGIDVDKVIRLVWVAATGLAGLSGIMLALILNGVKWDTGMQILLLLFAAVTLGGLGTAFGALVGALIVGMVVELAPVAGLPGDLKYAAALLILILLLMVRPQGLLGRAQRVG